jgi:hypothetical protein
MAGSDVTIMIVLNVSILNLPLKDRFTEWDFKVTYCYIYKKSAV